MTPPLPEVLAAVTAMDAAEAAFVSAHKPMGGEYPADLFDDWQNAIGAASNAAIAYCRTLKPGSEWVSVEELERLRRDSADCDYLQSMGYVGPWRASILTAEVQSLAAAQPPARGGAV